MTRRSRTAGLIAVGRRRVAIVAVSAAVGALGLATGALALFPDSNIASYAGCLNTGGSAAGTFSQLAQGDSPAKGCGNNQTVVHLSGGDITKVTAGTGLTGGGDNGAITLSLGGGYSLPQTCANDQTPVWNGTTWGCVQALPQSCSTGQVLRWSGTAWTCTTPALPLLYEATSSSVDFPDSGNLDPPGTTLVSLTIPTAGSYLVTARTDLVVIDDGPIVCRLLHGSGTVFDTSGADLEGAATFGTNANAEVVTLQGRITVAANDTVTLACTNQGGNQSAAHNRIDAIQVAP